MPWFVTAYNADGSTVANPEGSLVGSYGSHLHARSFREARKIARLRNLNETVIGQKPLNLCPYRPPSEWLKKRRPNPTDVFHSLCWMGHLALKSGVATVDEILGDQGLIHEYAHMRSGIAGRRNKLIEMAQNIERRIPGFL